MSKHHKSRASFDLIGEFFSAYPGRSSLMIVCLLLSGLAEGVGFATVLPLLQHMEGGVTTSGSTLVSHGIEELLGIVGLTPGIGALLSLIVVGMVLKALFLLLAMSQAGYTVAHVATDLRLALIRAVMNARWRFFITQPSGMLGNAISTEATRASAAYYSACMIFSEALQVLVYMVLAATVSLYLTLAAVSCGFLLAFLFWHMIGFARRAGEAQTQLQKSILSVFVDGLQGIKPLKAMAREDRLGPILERENESLKNSLQRQVLYQQVVRTQQEPIIVALLALGMYVVSGSLAMSMATMLMMALLFHRTVSRIGDLQKRFQSLTINESAYWSLRKLIDSAQQEHESTGGIRKPSMETGIHFEHVYFSYEDKPVLTDTSFSIPAKGIVTLVGPSGSGKTTLVDLVAGLYQPDSGKILVDGVQLNELDLAAWRHMIGYVPQEMILFYDTVLANITLGDIMLSVDDARHAVKSAGLEDFILSLPMGLDTIVGERGVKLSGGQRQRLAIARALIRSPHLLILDEVTTALDPATEKSICDTLQSLSHNMSILAISHQPAIAKVADIVLKVEHGHVNTLKSIHLS